MQAGAGTAHLAGHHRQRDQAARVVRAVDVLRNAHAPQDHRALRRREEARHFADRRRRNAADRRHRLGTVRGHVGLQFLVAQRAVGDEALRDQALLDDRVHHRVEQRDVGIGLELQVMRRVPRELRAARVGEDQLRAVLDRVLDPRRRHRMVDDRIGADQQHDVGLQHVHHRVRHRAGADAFEQRRDARRMAQPRAVVDVVGAEARPHQLLEQVRFLVRALGRPESRQRARPVLIADTAQRAAGQRQRLVPARLAEGFQRIRRIHCALRILGHARLADQRPREPLRMVHVVEAEAALHAQPVVIGRTVAPFDAHDLVVLDVIRELAADAAIRAQRRDGAVGRREIRFLRRSERAGGTRLHAFAARDARRLAHRVVQVEDDLRVRAAQRETDHVVDLFLAARAHAARALDAGVEVDRHRRMRNVRRRLRARREPRTANAQRLLPVIELGVGAIELLRNVGREQFDDHLLRMHGARAVARDLHAGVSARGSTTAPAPARP